MNAAHIAIALCVIVIIGVGIYGLREYLWMRAYNAGFVFGQINPGRLIFLSIDLRGHDRFAFQRSAWNLGYRHAKGY